MSPFIAALIICAALLLSGLVSTIETALSTISVARVENMAKEEGSHAVRRLLRMVRRRGEYINLLVLGRTILDTTAAVFAALLVYHLIDTSTWALVIAIAVISLVSFAIIGVFSRTVGRKNPYSISLGSSLVLYIFGTIFSPFSRLLIRIGNTISPGGDKGDPYASEVELRELVDKAQQQGVVEVEERRMIQSVFDLASTTARSVMVPRPEMLWIESGKTAGQATSLCVRSGHSRIPVIGETVDDILGVVYLKDLVERTYYATDGGRSVTVDEIMRPAIFVPDSKNLDALLQEMQHDRNHIAMLVDEYGGIAGLISIEDILEEIVGEIADEYDELEVAPIEPLALEETDGVASAAGSMAYRVVSRLSLDDLVEQIHEDHGDEGINIEFDEEICDQVDTVGGLLAYELGRVPLPGTTVRMGMLELKAEGGRDRRGRIRMQSVVVTLLTPEQEQEEHTGAMHAVDTADTAPAAEDN
ncbi:hemolysin family protein [Corynebacterium sp. sy039]|uniref:hemolysin family protein n=1 Tax=Corynebacterium sp. sy039 TaxID=2599641 RepID=UPI0011B63D44|nr:hemolysin family protein [Corynebacterium sp. sy039]QDZ43016.1 HlyC/CorC family transporter [Corynebacterium sp. sy039]